MKKSLISLALSLCLAFSGTAFAATGFSDLNEFHAWAEPQIEKMTTLGIIKGYTDGTFRPDQAITKAEALVLTARVAGYADSDYADYVKPVLTEYISFVSRYEMSYPNEAAFLMYKHILSEDDMASFLADGRASNPLSRTEMAVLAVKLLRAEGSLRDASAVTLPYDDNADIPYEYYPYVNYVTENAVMNGVYDPLYPNSVFFKPSSPVTRAQMAVLLYRLLDKIDITTAYNTAIGRDGTNNTLTFSSSSGVTIYNIPANVNLVIDGYYADSVAYAQASGAKVCFFYINGVLTDLEIVNDEANRFDGEFDDPGDVVPTGTVTGTIASITTSASGASVDVGGQTYAISSSVVVYVNDVASTIYDLRQGQSASIILTDGLATRIDAYDSSLADGDLKTLSGTVDSLSSAKRTVDISYTSSSGETLTKKFNVETGAVIVNAATGKSVDLSDIEEGSSITVTGALRGSSFYVSKIVIY